MKRSIITSVLLILLIPGFAQQRPEPKIPTPEQVAQREANILSERLTLTEDQRSKAYSVYLDRAKKQQAERELRLKEMQKQREQNAAQVKQQAEKISQFLNEDQKKMYQQFQAQKPSRLPGRLQLNKRLPGPGFRQDVRRGRLQGPVRPYLHFQRTPQQQFQQRGPGFQSRPEIRKDFRNRPQGIRPNPQFNARPQNRIFQNRPDSLQRQQRRMPLPTAPGKVQPVPADKN